VNEARAEEASPTEHRSSVWRWWKSLAEEDRAGRAELRRCGTVGEVAFTAPYHRLLQRLGSRLGEGDAKRVAVLVAVLAHVDEEPAEDSSLARRMGTPKGEGQGPLVSDARFRHLLRNEEPDELLRELVRAIRQLDRKASVDSIFRDVMRWDEPTRMRWAREFYEASAPVPTKKS
jgi:CRISPR system Cascade subunit CasB